MNKRFIKTFTIVSIGLIGIVAILTSMVCWMDIGTTGDAALDFLFFLFPIQLLIVLSLLIGFFVIVVALLRIRRIPVSAIKLFYFSITFFAAPFILFLLQIDSGRISMIIAESLTILCPLILAMLTKRWMEN